MLERSRDAAMQRATRVRIDRFIDRSVHELMRERETGPALRREPDEPAIEQFVQCVRHFGERPAASASKHLDIEADAAHRGDFSERARAFGEAREPSAHASGDSRGNAGGSAVSHAFQNNLDGEKGVAIARTVRVARDRFNPIRRDERRGYRSNVGELERSECDRRRA